MAGEIIRPSALPNRASPVASEKIPVDNGSTVGGATIESIVLAGRPSASQAEAEAGVNSVNAMTPLTTKQAIQAQGDSRFASAAQGALAATAVQPSRAITVGAGLAGGGDLSADRSIALSSGSITSLAKADSALQSVVAGDNVTVDNTDPRNPIITASGDSVFTAIATQAQAIAGTDNTTGMSPLRVREAIAAQTLGLAGRREKLINGRLLVNQRGVASGSIIAGGVEYVGDLWVISNATNATLTWSVASSQSFGRNREENALTISFASAPTSGDVFIQYRAEGVNIVAGATVTARLNVLNVGILAAAPLSVFFIQNFGTGGSANVNVSAVTPPETGVGPRRAVVVLPSTAGKTIGAGNFLEQRWAFTPRAIGTMTVASFSMVEGDASAEPNAPDGPPLPVELAECQWQFVRVTGLPIGSRFATGVGTGANNSQYTLPFQMRISPAASHSGMTVATGGASPAITAISANGNSAAGVGIQATAATTATDALAQLRASGTSAYLDLYAGFF